MHSGYTDAMKAEWRNEGLPSFPWARITLGQGRFLKAGTTDQYATKTLYYTIPATSIVGNTVKITESISDSEQLKFGSVEPSTFEAQIVEDTAQITEIEATIETVAPNEDYPNFADYQKGRFWDLVIGKPVQIGFCKDDTFFPRPALRTAWCVFYVQEIKSEGTTGFKTIYAQDELCKFDRDVSDWYNNLDFTSLTLGDMRKSLCTYVGVNSAAIQDATLPNDSMQVQRTMTATSLNGNTVLAAMCELNACWAHPTQFVAQTPASYRLGWLTLGATSCETFDYSQYDYTFRPDSTREEYDCKGINAVVVRATADDVGGHYPATVQDNPYIIQGNFLCFGKTTAELTTIAQNVYNAIANKPYRPHKTVITGRPYLEPGDKVTVKFAEGNGGTFDTYILKRTMTGEAALLDTYEAKGQKEHREQYGISQQIQQIQGRTNELTRTVDETVNTITRIEYLTPVLSKTDPSAEWADDEKAAKEGYQWFDGTDLRIWDGAAWKLTIYPDYNQSTQPNNAKEGEYWYNPTTGEIKKLVGDTWTADSTVCIPTTWTQTMQTQLKITAEGVQSTVTKDNIISTINQSAESVSINASKIDLTGYVTINSLKAGGTTQIDGGRITTGTVAAARIDVDNLYVKHLSAADGTFTGTLQAASGTFDTLDAVGGYVHFGYNFLRINGVEIGYYPGYSEVCIVPPSHETGNLGAGTLAWNQCVAKYLHSKNGSVQSYSMRKLKKDIENYPYDPTLIDRLQPVTFRMKDDTDNIKYVGLIADDVQEVEPLIVHPFQDEGMPEAILTIEYAKVGVLLINEIKALRQRVKKLEERRFI